MNNQLENIGKEVIELFQKRISDNGSNFTGKLSSSFVYVVSKDNINIYANEYAVYLNDGTRGTETGLNRKMPPIKAIKPWALAHNLNPWAVAKHIQLYGTKPHPFMFNEDKEVDTIIKENMDDYFEWVGEKVYKNLLNLKK